MELSYDKIRQAYQKLAYPFGPFNVFGIRAKERNTNAFDDLIGWIDDKGNFLCYNATTDPGFARNGNAVPEGTAIMKSGFYKGMYTLGLHRGNPKHPCLRQVGPALFYRVKNGRLFDETTVFRGVIGANIHGTREDFTPEEVHNFSKGCQVIRRWMSHLRFLAACRQMKNRIFDYALFTEKEVIG